MTKTMQIEKTGNGAVAAEAELSLVFREIDRRLKRMRKMDAEIDRLKERTRASLARLKAS